MATVCRSNVQLAQFSFGKSTGLRANALKFQGVPAQKGISLRKPVKVKAATAVETEFETINFQGESVGKKSIKLNTAGDNSNGVVHRAVVQYMAAQRQGSANTKTRSEVRGGGKKPYKQKGTGNARRGSQRTPLRVGGGVVHGPKPKDWSHDMNKKEKRLAFSCAIQSAACDSKVVEDLTGKFASMKTKDAVGILKNWGIDAKEDKALLLVKEYTDDIRRSTRNIELLETKTLDAMTIRDVLNADKIVIEETMMEDIEARYSGSYSRHEKPTWA